MTFELLIKQINKGDTFEHIVNEQDYNLVECIENKVYYDTGLDSFMETIDACIEDFGVGYAIIRTTYGKVYEVPYKEIKNRFDSSLDDEIILLFEPNKIYDVTDSYM